MAGRLPGRALIDRRPPRALFSELLAGALERTRVQPSPLATAYLVGLLDERVRQVPAAREPGAGAAPSLAEELLQARLERGSARVRRLRGLGDRVLFATGFFRDNLERRVVGLAYCRDAGRLAYAGASAAQRSLGRAGRRGTPVPELFEELADRFPEFSEVLTEVGDLTRAALPGGLDALYARFLRTGSERDRRRLMRRGHAVLRDGTPRAQ
jgi:hypothetical protein